MRFAAVAVDYDGTLARDGVVDPVTITAIEQYLQSGRKFILVTGRIVKDLLVVFPQARLCTSIVGENGAVLYDPVTDQHEVLGAPPPAAFIEALVHKQVSPLEVGESIIATLRPHEIAALEAIRDLGLEHHVVFNRESVMILPSGVNKATGLMVALKHLGLSPHNVVGIGDSENDHALFEAVECGVAVRNAIPTLRERADVVTSGESGAGVSEVLQALVQDDLQTLVPNGKPGGIQLGQLAGGHACTVPFMGDNVLLAGSAGDTAHVLSDLLKQLAARHYQCCLIDPQGVQQAFDGAVKFGTAQKTPLMAEIMTALEAPDNHILVDLVSLPPHERTAFAILLLERLHERQEQTGRPHRVVINGSETLFADDDRVSGLPWWSKKAGLIYCASTPAGLAQTVLRTVEWVIALGAEAGRSLESYAQHAGLPWSGSLAQSLGQGEGFIWQIGRPPQRFQRALRDPENIPVV
jgi:phosphoglycolate phosphatase (TIGR01487 family)